MIQKGNIVVGLGGGTAKDLLLTTFLHPFTFVSVGYKFTSSWVIIGICTKPMYS